MIVVSESFDDGAEIPQAFAMVQAEPETKMKFSDNLNPHLRWDEVPEGTKSFVVVCYDEDAPVAMEDVNRDDVEIPTGADRQIFYHWALVDIPSHMRTIEEGQFSREFKMGGKLSAERPHGMREGLNDFTSALAGHEEMGGEYFGYDGPCPPWNDLKPHRYQFVVYALDVEKCPVGDSFYCQDVIEAIRDNTLAMASISGTYAL